MKNWNYKNFTIHQYEELASTNSTALEKASLGQIVDGEIIMANTQNSGRGRMDRGWSSPKGNLYFSLVLQPKALAAHMAQISFVAIVALRQAVEGLVVDDIGLEKKSVSKLNALNSSNLNIQNKWPNDLLINKKKVAGILLESKNNQQNCEFIVLGIGVNIVSNPDNTIFPAANLLEFGLKISPEDLLKKFLENFENLYQNWQNFGFENIRKAWLSKAYNLQEKITISEDNKKIEGIFEDMDKDGALILLTELGIKKVFAGDVFNL